MRALGFFLLQQEMKQSSIPKTAISARCHPPLSFSHLLFFFLLLLSYEKMKFNFLVACRLHGHGHHNSRWSHHPLIIKHTLYTDQRWGEFPAVAFLWWTRPEVDWREINLRRNLTRSFPLHSWDICCNQISPWAKKIINISFSLS